MVPIAFFRTITYRLLLFMFFCQLPPDNKLEEELERVGGLTQLLRFPFDIDGGAHNRTILVSSRSLHIILTHRSMDN